MIEINFKNIVRIITALAVGIYLSYCVYYFMTNETHPKYKDCGVIVSKSSDEVIIKHGTRTDLYLNIQFEKSEFRSVNVDPTTYFSNKKGDYVCFYLNQTQSISHNIHMIVAMTTLVIIGILSLSMFLIYLFN